MGLFPTTDGGEAFDQSPLVDQIVGDEAYNNILLVLENIEDMEAAAQLGKYQGEQTGSVERTSQDARQDFITTKDYNCVCDGVADDTTALEASIDALIARGGGDLLMVPGDYLISDYIHKEIPDGMTVRILAHGARILAPTLDTEGEAVIKLGGQRTLTSTTLNAAVDAGDAAWNVLSTTNISQGKILLMTSTDLFNPARSYYYKGELIQVAAVDGTEITASNQLFDSYSQVTSTLHVLDMPTVIIEGLTIECDAYVRGLALEYVRNPILNRISVNGARYTGISVHYYFGGSITECYVRDAWVSGDGTSYGIHIGSGQGMAADRNVTSDTRHGITCGGYEPCRNVRIMNNHCLNSTEELLVGSIDCHGNTSGIIISGNITSGISIGGRNAHTLANKHNTIAGTAPAVHLFQEIDSDYYIFESEKAEQTGNGMGFYLRATVAGLSIGLLAFRGCHTKSVQQALYIQPGLTSATTWTIDRLLIEGSSFESETVQGAVLQSNISAILTIGELVTVGNSFSGLVHNSFFLGSTAEISRYRSLGDTFKANLAGNYAATINADDVRMVLPTFIGNAGGAGNSRSVNFQKANSKIQIISPRYSGFDNGPELEAAGPIEFMQSGWNSPTPPILNSASALLVSYYTVDGKRVMQGTAAPVAGQFYRGERVVNTLPDIGSPKGWICYDTGTPGLWQSEGNL